MGRVVGRVNGDLIGGVRENQNCASRLLARDKAHVMGLTGLCILVSGKRRSVDSESVVPGYLENFPGENGLTRKWDCVICGYDLRCCVECRINNSHRHRRGVLGVGWGEEKGGDGERGSEDAEGECDVHGRDGIFVFTKS